MTQETQHGLSLGIELMAVEASTTLSPVLLFLPRPTSTARTCLIEPFARSCDSDLLRRSIAQIYYPDLLRRSIAQIYCADLLEGGMTESHGGWDDRESWRVG